MIESQLHRTLDVIFKEDDSLRVELIP